MLTASSLLLGLLFTVVFGALGTFYFWNVRRRQDEAEAGIRALSAMRWREFSHFVLDAMRHRGYDVLTPDDEAERSQQTEFLLRRDGQRLLLGCKHGSAYRIAAPAIAEFASSIKFQGARGGVLVTPGQIEADARAPAAAASIELIDGAHLWPEVAPLLPRGLVEEVRREADERARRSVSLGWLGAVVVGFALGLVFGSLLPRDDAPAAPAATPVAAAAAQQAPAVAAPQAATPAPAPSTTSTSIPATTQEQEDAQRVEVVQRISNLPGVDRALWSTKSTLLVHVDETSSDRLSEICAVLDRYETLRTARVHLQPPAGSEQRVRFRQCRTY